MITEDEYDWIMIFYNCVGGIDENTERTAAEGKKIGDKMLMM
jgi:hypothetical protein